MTECGSVFVSVAVSGSPTSSGSFCGSASFAACAVYALITTFLCVSGQGQENSKIHKLLGFYELQMNFECSFFCSGQKTQRQWSREQF